MNIAIIPARGGSKRIPRKNIKHFCGKPIIAYSIEAAQKADCFDRIIVSTDDDEIAAIAKQYGAEIPFIRPQNISDDFATTLDVIQHAVTALNLENTDNICCIYATAPFITAADITAGYTMLSHHNNGYVFSATEYTFPTQRAFYLTSERSICMFQPEHFSSRSQDLEKSYHDAGQFYWGQANTFNQNIPVFSKHSTIIKLPKSRVQDIDTPEDWEFAEILAVAQKLRVTKSENSL